MCVSESRRCRRQVSDACRETRVHVRAVSVSGEVWARSLGMCG